jgi:two-component system sensor histidine kinase UhpB
MSLRLRVVGLIGVVLLISIVLGALVAGVQSKIVLRAELNAALLGAEQTVKSAYEDLPNSDHQERDLHQLVSTFDGNRHVKASLISGEGRPVLTSKSGSPLAEAPRWFQHLIGTAPQPAELQVPEGVPGFFAIVLTPTANIDEGDAWVQFWRVAVVLVGSAAFGLFLVYLVIGAAFRPLIGLSAEFARIGTGDYAGRVEERGPPEVLSLQQGFNKMVGQLSGTTARNRHLTEQLVTIQDEERADIARDLHDEIGPHLFGVNMDAEMIMQLHEAGRGQGIPDQVRSIQTAVGHMQRQVRDLLGRLRPARVTEFGLNAAIRDLATFWATRRPEIAFELTLPHDDEGVPETVKEAAYRIVQEAANNSVRHANPMTVQVCVEIQNESDLVVMVFDDGVEAAGRQKVGGLGLVGMRERVHALGGSLLFGRTAGAASGWSVVARLPIDHLAWADRKIEARV